MNQTIRQRRDLHRATHQGQRNPRRRNAGRKAAHPIVASALAGIASKSAGALERFADSWTFFWMLGIVSAAIFAARVGGAL